MKWPKELRDRVKEQAERRGVTFSAFVYRACETLLAACETDGRPVAMQLGLPVLNVVVEQPASTQRRAHLNVARAGDAR
jgi:hypothetical protein